MLIAALGCNFAWGIIDGVFYLMGCLAEAARKVLVWDAVRNGADPDAARQALAGALPPTGTSALQPGELEAMRLRLVALPEPSDRSLLRRHDVARRDGRVPPRVPLHVPGPRSEFIYLKDVRLALRISNAIAIVLLFLTGYSFGRHIGRRPVWTGIAMVILGVVLVGLTIALGG